MVINKNDGNATDDSGIDSIEQNHSSPEPHNLQFLRFKNSDINHQTGGNSGNNFKKIIVVQQLHGNVNLCFKNL